MKQTKNLLGVHVSSAVRACIHQGCLISASLAHSISFWCDLRVRPGVQNQMHMYLTYPSFLSMCLLCCYHWTWRRHKLPKLTCGIVCQCLSFCVGARVHFPRSFPTSIWCMVPKIQKYPPPPPPPPSTMKDHHCFSRSALTWYSRRYDRVSV